MVGFVTAPAIAWGPGALQQLSGLGAERPVLLVDPGVAKQEGPHRVAEELGRGGAAVVTLPLPAEANRLSAVATLAGQLRAHDADWVVVVGGGTAIDAAKAARLLRERPELALERAPVDAAVPAPARSRLVAVPTTSGSGAEASWSADLVAEDGTPVELADRSLVPEWAIVDPWFARELPAAALVAGAFESAALATEAYVSAWANPFSDALAADAVRTVAGRLTHAVRWSDDPDARAALHYAATSAGLAHSNAQRGLAHALARALVRPTRLSYAQLLGIVLPAVLEFDRPGARERLEALALTLRGPEETSVASVADRLRRLGAALGVAANLASAGVDAELLRRERPRIVAETLRSPAVLANPRVPTADDVGKILDGVTGTPATGPGRPSD